MCTLRSVRIRKPKALCFNAQGTETLRKFVHKDLLFSLAFRTSAFQRRYSALAGRNCKRVCFSRSLFVPLPFSEGTRRSLGESANKFAFLTRFSYLCLSAKVLGARWENQQINLLFLLAFRTFVPNMRTCVYTRPYRADDENINYLIT